MNFLLQKLYNRFIYRPIIKWKLNTVGENFRLGYSSEIINPKYFNFGNHFYSGPFSYFGTNKNHPVQIGDFVMFGPKCTIQGGNHDIEFEGYMFNNTCIDHSSDIIKIENGVWIGSCSTIINGAIIGEGSIIGAMSLVNKKIPPFVVAAGIPIKTIKPRFKKISQLENTLKNTKSKYKLKDILEEHINLGFYYND